MIGIDVYCPDHVAGALVRLRSPLVISGHSRIFLLPKRRSKEQNSQP
jgi:hypothetical protein